MTKKGYLVLDSIVKNSKSSLIDFVCIGKDSKLDNDFCNELTDLCVKNNINYYYKDSIDLKEKNSEFYIAISWKWIIDLPNLIILHDSLLPKYRGFSPLVNMLINGEKKFGVTAIYATNEYDKGDVIKQEAIEVNYPKKITDLIDEISLLYAKIVLSLFDKMAKNEKIIGIKQIESEATYSVWLNGDDYFIDWNWNADKIKRKIDACCSPYEGAKCRINDEVIIILEADVVADVKVENRMQGKVLFIKDDCPIVICGEGLLQIKKAIYKNSSKMLLPLNNFRIKFE